MCEEGEAELTLVKWAQIFVSSIFSAVCYKETDVHQFPYFCDDLTDSEVLKRFGGFSRGPARTVRCQFSVRFGLIQCVPTWTQIDRVFGA